MSNELALSATVTNRRAWRMIEAHDQLGHPNINATSGDCKRFGF